MTMVLACTKSTKSGCTGCRARVSTAMGAAAAATGNWCRHGPEALARLAPDLVVADQAEPGGVAGDGDAVGGEHEVGRT